MAHTKDGSWSIANGTEAAPDGAEALQKNEARREKALALVGASSGTLIALGDPADPKVMWTKLEKQFSEENMGK